MIYEYPGSFVVEFVKSLICLECENVQTGENVGMLFCEFFVHGVFESKSGVVIDYILNDSGQCSTQSEEGVFNAEYKSIELVN